jgi:hypothetical protein
MTSKIIYNGFLVYITQIVNSIGNFAYYYLLLIFLNNSELGFYYSMTRLLSLITLITSSGLGNLLLIDLKKKGTKDRIHFIISILLLMNIIASISIPFYVILHRNFILTLLSIFFITVQPIFMLINTIIGAILQRSQKFVSYSIFTITMSLMKFLIFLLFLIINDGLDAALIGSSIMYISISFFFIRLLYKSLNFKKLFNFSDYLRNRKDRKKDLKYFSNYYLLGFFTSSIIPGFIFISSFFLENSIIGEVSALNVFPQMIWTLSSAVLFFVFPFMIENKFTKNFFIITIKFMSLVVIPSYILLNFGYRYIMIFLNLQNRFSDYIFHMLFLSIYWIFKIVVDLFQRYYLIKNDFKLIFKGYIFGYLISFISFFILVIFNKTYTLPISYIIAISSILICYTIEFTKELEENKEKKNLIKTVIGIPSIFIISFILLCFIEKYIVYIKNLYLQITFLFLISLVISAFFVISILFNKNDILTILYILRKKNDNKDEK